MNTFYEFKNSEQIKEYKINITDFDKLISDRELLKIYEGIDKTDFTYMGEKRWFDLDKIVKKILEIKLNKTNLFVLSLHKLEIISIQETWPPVNKYKYKFIFEAID
jgi:hypothetical protein